MLDGFWHSVSFTAKIRYLHQCALNVVDLHRSLSCGSVARPFTSVEIVPFSIFLCLTPSIWHTLSLWVVLFQHFSLFASVSPLYPEFCLPTLIGSSIMHNVTLKIVPLQLPPRWRRIDWFSQIPWWHNQWTNSVVGTSFSMAKYSVVVW